MGIDQNVDLKGNFYPLNLSHRCATLHSTVFPLKGHSVCFQYSVLEIVSFNTHVQVLWEHEILFTRNECVLVGFCQLDRDLDLSEKREFRFPGKCLCKSGSQGSEPVDIFKKN